MRKWSTRLSEAVLRHSCLGGEESCVAELYFAAVAVVAGIVVPVFDSVVPVVRVVAATVVFLDDRIGLVSQTVAGVWNTCASKFLRMFPDHP